MVTIWLLGSNIWVFNSLVNCRTDVHLALVKLSVIHQNQDFSGQDMLSTSTI